MAESLLAALVLAPGLAFSGLGLAWLAGYTPHERLIARLTAAVYSFCVVAAAAGWAIGSNTAAVRTPVWYWFQAGSYHFEISLLADRLSWPLIELTAVLVGLTGVFSVRYLHRDRGYFRFFLLLHLFAFAALLTLAAGTFDLLAAGWELVGVSSVLLIAFFDERREPVRNAVRVFAYYRVSGLGLLLAIYLLHRLEHTTEAAKLFRVPWPDDAALMSASAATLVGLLLVMAAAGKAAQFPFSGWLPRAMEGPTPSSAIFYGAISVHLGAYLLLRAEPVLRASGVAAWTCTVVGLLTAALATLVHRASVDAKTSLAYAGMAQLGIIFAEIGLGFPRLALVHVMGHAVVRTLQFLRAPSMLHDYHRVHAAAGGELGRTGAHYHHLLPERFRLALYRAALERGYLDAWLSRYVTGPVLSFGEALESWETGERQGTAGEPSRLAGEPEG